MVRGIYLPVFYSNNMFLIKKAAGNQQLLVFFTADRLYITWTELKVLQVIYSTNANKVIAHASSIIINISVINSFDIIFFLPLLILLPSICFKFLCKLRQATLKYFCF
jgi:hypothetical protein